MFIFLHKKKKNQNKYDPPPPAESQSLYILYLQTRTRDCPLLKLHVMFSFYIPILTSFNFFHLILNFIAIYNKIKKKTKTV